MARARRYYVGEICEKTRLHGSSATVRRCFFKLRWLPCRHPAGKWQLEVCLLCQRVRSQRLGGQTLAFDARAEIINASPTPLGHERQLFLPGAATVAIIRLLQTSPE